jgi:transposase
MPCACPALIGRHKQVSTTPRAAGSEAAPWRDAPSVYGPWQTLSTRFYRWVKAGIWDQILAALQ